MKLFLIQHGMANESDIDPDRNLSHEGRCVTEKVARHFAKFKEIGKTRIYSSSKRRAKATALIFDEWLVTDGEVIELDFVNPESDVSQMIEFIQKKCKERKKDNIALIGHLPFLSNLVSKLINNDENKKIVNFHNSAIVCLDSSNCNWTISWIMHPDYI